MNSSIIKTLSLSVFVVAFAVSAPITFGQEREVDTSDARQAVCMTRPFNDVPQVP